MSRRALLRDKKNGAEPLGVQSRAGLWTLEGLQIRSMKQRKLAKEVTLNVLYKALLTIKKVCWRSVPLIIENVLIAL